MRTRLRTLRIGERTYTWRATIGQVAGDGVDQHRCVRVRAWGAGKTGLALEADLLSKATGAGWTPAATDGSYPASADVRRLIEHALALGWDPGMLGGTFRLTEEHGVELPGFLLTDRVRDPGAPDPTARVIRAAGAQDRLGSSANLPGVMQDRPGVPGAAHPARGDLEVIAPAMGEPCVPE